MEIERASGDELKMYQSRYAGQWAKPSEGYGYYPPDTVSRVGGAMKRSAEGATVSATRRYKSLHKCALDLRMHPWAMLLGDPGVMLSQQYLAQNPHSWNVPNALQAIGPGGERRGASHENLMQTINHIFAAQNEVSLWRLLLPIRTISPEALPVVGWTVTEFPPTYAKEIPLNGAPVFTIARASGGREVLKLRGIGAQIGMGFLNTELGRRHWAASIIQVADGIQLSSQVGAAIHMVNSDRILVADLRTRGTYAYPTISSESRSIAQTFACLQVADGTSFVTLHDRLLHRLQARQAGDMPNPSSLAMVISSDVARLLKHQNKEAITYNFAGKDGPARLSDQKTIGNFRLYDIEVFALKPFNLPNALWYPLARPIEVGEYYPMYHHFNGDGPADTGKYIEARAINIYSMSHGWTKITLEQAVDNAGDISAVINSWATDRLLRQPDPKDAAAVAAAAAAAAKGAKINAEFAAKNKLNFIIARPHMQFLADDALLLPPGNFGYRVIQPGFVAVADDINSMSHMIVANFRTGCAIHSAKYVVTARATMLREYWRGAECVFNKPAEIATVYRPGSDTGIFNDLISIVLPPSWKNKFPEVINLAGSVTGTLSSWYTPERAPDGIDPTSYPGAAVYNELYGWTKDCKAGERDVRVIRMEAVPGLTFDMPVNVFCRRGHSQLCDENGAFTVEDLGNGYFPAGSIRSLCHNYLFNGIIPPHIPRGNVTYIR